MVTQELLVGYGMQRRMMLLALWFIQFDGWRITTYGITNHEFGVGHVEFEVTLRHEIVELGEITEDINL